ncbi:MAG: TIGR03936 family radical SAM-associated protein [Ruminococcus sp.]|nr:TIGR03936 family radical SAM-associated protein [Ruminococcus sp.]
MQRLRAVFEKTGRAKYISHLDLNRCMLRIFRRSGLPIWYTEGFNPHPYYSFALALSLGFESRCEIMDFNITDDAMSADEIRDRLNTVMPEGMGVVSVAPQVQKITAITHADYSFTLETASPDRLKADIDRLLSAEEILIEKKTKKGVRTVDIKPDMQVTDCRVADSGVEMSLRLPAGTQTNYNPTLFFEALKNTGAEPFEPCRICRTAILCADGSNFA